MDKKGRYFNEIKNMSFALLSEGKSIRIKAQGYSMFPAIKPGTVVIIEPLKVKGPPAPGEIVAIKRNKGIVVHRIVKITEENGVKKYIARGDSNSTYDPPVTIDMIPGRVTGAEGYARMPSDFTVKPRYFINRLRVIMIHIGFRLKRLTGR